METLTTTGKCRHDDNYHSAESYALSFLKSKEWTPTIEEYWEKQMQLCRLRKFMVNENPFIKELRKHPRYLTEKDWERIEQILNSIYKDFTKKQKELYPDLTPNEVHLCYALKLEFDNKQIAIFFGISPSSVSQNKTRLKKLLLQTEETPSGKRISLDEFIRWFNE